VAIAGKHEGEGEGEDEGAGARESEGEGERESEGEGEREGEIEVPGGGELVEIGFAEGAGPDVSAQQPVEQHFPRSDGQLTLIGRPLGQPVHQVPNLLIQPAPSVSQISAPAEQHSTVPAQVRQGFSISPHCWRCTMAPVISYPPNSTATAITIMVANASTI
jgi:hypothetical protein